MRKSSFISEAFFLCHFCQLVLTFRTYRNVPALMQTKPFLSLSHLREAIHSQHTNPKQDVFHLMQLSIYVPK